jgi:integrase
MIPINNGNNDKNVFVQMTLGQDFNKNNGHDNLINDFEKWLRKQNNKTLYKRFRMRTPLKPSNQKQIVKKVKTAIQRDMNISPEKLSYNDIKSWEDYCYETYSNNGNSTRFIAINKFLKFIDKEEWKLPCPPGEIRVYPTLTEEERTLYLQTLDKYYPPLGDRMIDEMLPMQLKRVMDRCIVLMQTMLCCRPTEICIIETRDVDFLRHKITLRDSKTHEIIIRSGMEDVLLMTKEVEAALKDWLEIRKKVTAKEPVDEKYLFIYPAGNNAGTRIHYWKVWRVCKRVGRLAVIKDIKTTPYLLKRTEITRDCDRGLNIRIPQIRARHTSPMTTMRYNHKSIFDAINWIQSDNYYKNETLS